MQDRGAGSDLDTQVGGQRVGPADRGGGRPPASGGGLPRMSASEKNCSNSSSAPNVLQCVHSQLPCRPSSDFLRIESFRQHTIGALFQLWRCSRMHVCQRGAAAQRIHASGVVALGRPRKSCATCPNGLYSNETFDQRPLDPRRHRERPRKAIVGRFKPRRLGSTYPSVRSRRRMLQQVFGERRMYAAHIRSIQPATRWRDEQSTPQRSENSSLTVVMNCGCPNGTLRSGRGWPSRPYAGTASATDGIGLLGQPAPARPGPRDHLATLSEIVCSLAPEQHHVPRRSDSCLAATAVRTSCLEPDGFERPERRSHRVDHARTDRQRLYRGYCGMARRTSRRPATLQSGSRRAREVRVAV